MGGALAGLFATLMSMLFGSQSLAADMDKLIAASGTKHVQLIELYSSESCSSCPPADAWISELQGTSGLWTEYVPAVFHVDYWNHLDWKDGFSSDKMTKRQYDLSNRWEKPSVYTPAFVLDGREWRDWGTHKLPPSKNFRGIELFIYRVSEGVFRVKATGLQNGKWYTVHIVKLGMGLSTDVKSGENAGRTLKHNFVILSWEKGSLSSKTIDQVFTFETDTAKKVSRFAVAAWIEEQGNPTPLQSVGGYL
jgi:hypothetical protein